MLSSHFQINYTDNNIIYYILILSTNFSECLFLDKIKLYYFITQSFSLPVKITDPSLWYPPLFS
jgi:hypothetical protein